MFLLLDPYTRSTIGHAAHGEDPVNIGECHRFSVKDETDDPFDQVVLNPETSYKYII